LQCCPRSRGWIYGEKEGRGEEEGKGEEENEIREKKGREEI